MDYEHLKGPVLEALMKEAHSVAGRMKQRKRKQPRRYTSDGEAVVHNDGDETEDLCSEESEEETAEAVVTVSGQHLVNSVSFIY